MYDINRAWDEEFAVTSQSIAKYREIAKQQEEERRRKQQEQQRKQAQTHVPLSPPSQAGTPSRSDAPKQYQAPARQPVSALKQPERKPVQNTGIPYKPERFDYKSVTTQNQNPFFLTGKNRNAMLNTKASKVSLKAINGKPYDSFLDGLMGEDDQYSRRGGLGIEKDGKVVAAPGTTDADKHLVKLKYLKANDSQNREYYQNLSKQIRADHPQHTVREDEPLSIFEIVENPWELQGNQLSPTQQIHHSAAETVERLDTMRAASPAQETKLADDQGQLNTSPEALQSAMPKVGIEKKDAGSAAIRKLTARQRLHEILARQYPENQPVSLTDMADSHGNLYSTHAVCLGTKYKVEISGQAGERSAGSCGKPQGRYQNCR